MKQQKEGKKSEYKKSAINNIKTLQESREKLIRYFDDYPRNLAEAKYKTNYGKGFKILTLK